MEEKKFLLANGIDVTALIKAADSFNTAMNVPKDEMVRDASIQRFEFTFELCWKFMKKILAQRGTFENSPRPILREAAQEGLIDDLEQWFVFLEHRNKVAHTYNEDLAEKIYADLYKFKILLAEFLEKLDTLK